MEMTTIKKGDRVRVSGCRGTARVVKFCRKYGVFLLDRKLSVRFSGDGDVSVDTFVSYWTFTPEALTKIEVPGG